MTFGPLITPEELAERHSQVRTVDVRWYPDGRSGHDAYLAGHIEGAVYLDVDTDLAEPASREDGRHPTPSPQRFAEALGRIGVAAGTPVVAYDDAGGSVAARLWWLLHVLDEPVAVLDGGMQAWQALSGPLTTDVPDVAPVCRAPREWPSHRFADADRVAAVAADDTVNVYDARTAARYAGAPSPLDPRPGHVPGAHSAPWAGNLSDDGRFRTGEELRERFDAARPAIAYCGSGVTACHDLLAMELAGMTDTALYPGSWSQWAADPSRPAE
jgi:thiosulfate/3-mercaptopyruvate sulfurtransferase